MTPPTLTAEELTAIWGQCDGKQPLLLNVTAQNQVRAMIGELVARRASDKLVVDEDTWWGVRIARRIVAKHFVAVHSRDHEERREATTALDRLLAQEPVTEGPT